MSSLTIDLNKAIELAAQSAVQCGHAVRSDTDEDIMPEESAALTKTFYGYLTQDDTVDPAVRMQLFTLSVELIIDRLRREDITNLMPLFIEADDVSVEDGEDEEEIPALQLVATAVTQQCALLESAVDLRADVPMRAWPKFTAYTPPTKRDAKPPKDRMRR